MFEANSQFLIDFNNKAVFAEHDFFVNDANIKPLNFIHQWPHWGSHPMSSVLYLYGEEGSGKTHLANIWAKLSNAIFADAKNLEFARSNVIIDNLNTICDQEKFFHMINYIVNSGFFMLITSNKTIDELEVTLPDLKSRLNAANYIKIESLDEDLLKMILLKQISDKQIMVEPEALDYACARIERSYTTIKNLVEQLNVASLNKQRKITIPFIRQILQQLEK